MRDSYKKLCDEYSQKVKYPEYGEWCKESIYKTIKEYGVSDNEEYLKTKVFNPNSDLYECLDGNDPEYVLGWINYKPHFKESLFNTIWNNFADAYAYKYATLNKEFIDKEHENCLEAGFDIYEIFEGFKFDTKEDDYKLLTKALEEIGVDGLKEFIFQLVQK